MIIDFGDRPFESEGSAEGIFFTVYDGDEWIKLKVVNSSGDVSILSE